ncbi:MAG: low specificity L-threonine aldolase [Rhodospirillaceae bacterium]|nr:low specificity L-threonine aldolase [Rhodospirillaceae bacterium]
MNFRSDNEAPVAPEIMAAIVDANTGSARAYGNDAITGRLDAIFSDLFETPVQVFPVATGTAANSLALSVLTPPWGGVYCHEESHVGIDESGAPEMFTAGAKMIGLGGHDGKFEPAALNAAVDHALAFGVHHVAPAAVSIAQATEAGTVYTTDEVAALAEVARARGLGVHMDGARFGNALATLGCAPADLTWRAGVDVMSFGATKNGAMAAEAVVFFRPELAQAFGHRRKRGGQLFCKMRYVSAQFEAYLRDGLWLTLAGRANRAAKRLAEGLAALPGSRIAYPVQANEVFAVLPDSVTGGLIDDGFGFHPWPAEEGVVRFVTAFETSDGAVDALLDAARRHAASG